MPQIKIHIPQFLLDKVKEPSVLIRNLLQTHLEDNMSNLISSTEAAELWDLSPHYIKNLCREGKVKAKYIGKQWIIDKNQPNPKQNNTKYF